MTDFETGSHAVLFVDDEEKSRKYFALGVQSLFPVLTAASVAEGIAILQRDGHRIGVLITDQRMPGGNGVEILRYARENHPGIVRLLTTAYSDLEDAVSAVNSGEIIRYIRKPWQFDDLLQDIRQAMSYFILGLERDKLLAEKLSLRQIDVLVQQASALVELAGTVWETRAPMSAVRAFLGDAVHNHWLLGDADGQQPQYEQWRWMVERLQRSFGLVDALGWLRRPGDGFGTVVDAAGLAALIKTHGSWRDDGDAASRVTGEVTVAVNQAMLEGMVAGLIGRPDGPLVWLNGMLTCSITPATDQPGLLVEIRAPAGTEPGAVDFYAAMPLLGLYLFAHHHGGRCSIEHASAAIRLQLPSDPSPPLAAEAGLDWLEDLLGELVLVARGD